MMRTRTGRARIAGGAGLVVLGLAWLGPLPDMVAASFSAHMILHMSVVGIGVPLVAAGWVGLSPPGTATVAAPALAASLVDFAVVWLWHAPWLHHASRGDPAMLALEQASFAGATLFLWRVALGGPALVGAVALFVTSMHMVLLGTLLALAPRPLFHPHGGAEGGLLPLADQQLGGTIMMAMGSIIYFGAALLLAACGLRSKPAPVAPTAPSLARRSLSGS